MTHTPGPWFAIRQKGGDSEGSYEIAQEKYRGNAIGMTFIHVIGPNELLHPDFRDNIESNARLIAAAPELLEAAELARTELDRIGSDIGFEPERYQERINALDALYRAVRKATGGQR